MAKIQPWFNSVTFVDFLNSVLGKHSEANLLLENIKIEMEISVSEKSLFYGQSHLNLIENEKHYNAECEKQCW